MTSNIPSREDWEKLPEIQKATGSVLKKVDGEIPSREDWEEQLSDLFDGLWLDGSIDYSTEETFDKFETQVRIKDFIRNLLQAHNNALVAEIDNIKSECEHWATHQALDTIIRIIQEK